MPKFDFNNRTGKPIRFQLFNDSRDDEAGAVEPIYLTIEPDEQIQSVEHE
jgi:hypothetical protein